MTVSAWDLSLGFGIWELPSLSSVFVEVVVNREIYPKRGHRPEARCRDFVVFGPNGEVPRADPRNVNQASDRYHSHRLVLQRFQQRILLADLVELEGVIGRHPVGRCRAAGRDGRPIQAAPLLLLGSRCRREHDGDKQCCRKNPKRSTEKHAAIIGRNVLVL